MESSVSIVTQPRATSNLGRYVADWYAANGYSAQIVDCRAGFWARAWPALKAYHPDRGTWYRRRWERGLFSPEAWERNTRTNGRLLDRLGVRRGKILQVGKEYYPSPGFRDMEYYVFINYCARLSRSDGYTPWRPAREEEDEFIAKEDLLYRHAAHVFTCGEYLKKSLVEESGARADRVTAVGNGVNPYYLQRPPPPFGDRFANRLLFVGWDFGLKGGADLLAAMPAIRERYPHVELWVVGPDEAQRERQGELARAPGIRWIGPEPSRDRLIEHFREADLFVMPSLRDSYGFVFLEAMSQGLPCLGADMNGMPEIIADGETGYVVPRQSPERIAEAVCRYYSDGNNKQRMANATYQRLKERFTWDAVMAKVNAVMGI